MDFKGTDKWLHPLSYASFYQILISIFGLMVIYNASLEWTFELIGVYIFWAFLATVAELKPIQKPSHDHLTVSFAVHVSAFMIFGTSTAILISTIGNIIVDLVGKRGFNKLLFNVNQYALTIYISSFVFQKLRVSPDFAHVDFKHDFIAMLTSCLVYIFLNYAFVSIIISLSNKSRLFGDFSRDMKFELLHFVTLMPVSLMIVILYSVEPLFIFIVILPLAVAHFTFENYFSLRVETRNTIEVLADIVDKKDSYTFEHSFRVALYCRKLAEELGLSPEQVETIVSAARVHDLGKISTPEAVLLKKGALNDEERFIILDHPRVGYNILNNLRHYKSGAKFVLYHHERYDGKGYPVGLEGENIPLGARIMTIADSYDAMTTDRPYRKALSEEEALKELVRCSGTQFDPHLVNVFVNLINRKKQVYIDMEFDGKVNYTTSNTKSTTKL